MTDKGTGAENLIWLASRQGANPLLAADDILAALTERIAELETRVAAILADIDPTSTPAASSRGTHDAHIAADAELTRASEERQMLANEMRLLREAIQGARQDQHLARHEAVPSKTKIEVAVADEMRSLLTELLADFRSRSAAPPPVAPPPPPLMAAPAAPAPPPVETPVEVAITAEVVEPPAVEIRDAVVEDVEVAAPLADLTTGTSSPPIDPVESIVEHVDELMKPAARAEYVEYDEFIDDLPMPEPVGHVDLVPPVEPAAEPAIEETHVEAAMPEPIEPIIDERLQALRWTQPTVEIEPTELGSVAEPSEPRVEDIEEVLRTEIVPPVESFEVIPAPVEPADAIVEEYVEDFHQPEPIVDEYAAPTSDIAVTPPAEPPAVDPRIEAMWDTAASPPSFVPDDPVAEERPVEFDDAPSAAPLDVTPEPPVVFMPEPPEVFAPEPPMQFAIEPPVVFEPEPEARVEPPLITPQQPEETYVPIFPELRVADDRGLHQIQVVISPIHSFPRLLDTERRIRALSTVNALHLRDFRNGVATLTVSVSEAISPAEFGAVIQMLEDLHLRLEGTTLSSVELRAEDEHPTE